MNYINDKVNWGIIGVGNVCEKKSGPAFNKVPHSALVAVMRRTPGKAQDYARRHEVPKHYTSAHELINDAEVNAIYIATPPAFHESYALDCIEAGKPVYIEKPVSLNAASCQKLIDASIKNNVPVSVAHYRRRLPLFLKIKKLINKGTIGNIHLINIRLLQAEQKNIIAPSEKNWRVQPEFSGGGLFHDLAPHQLDIIYWLCGVPKLYSGYSLNQGKHYEAPDFCQLHAVYNNDIALNGTWSFSCHESNVEDSCEIIGSEGKLSFSFFRNPQLVIQNAKRIKTLKLPYPEHIQQPMITDVVQYFKGDAANPCSLEDALWTMKMMDSVS